ncbi:hypothetical protein HMPREF2811_01795 [Globicatella sp. HMSC072A10]|uniref:beta-galactosidase n=1 Tax=Globicatella sp. HMSC072A10 TaxID=1739315 RepID=UPI0008B564F5|nr:beta-galactosidase [Globicatella sp. HMSC072A10]OFK56511.1 hypothetical protein HMPREF2811_01795 [Globicatella sp. HMSC072A10]
MGKIFFGGDYNPQQWPESVWNDDMVLFEEANIDTVTVGVFMWGRLQSDEYTYDFSMLDRIMKRLKNENKNVILATATAAHPAWLARKYPDVTRVDFLGRKHTFGQRHNSNPNSKNYQHYAKILVRKIADRYKDYENIVAWHINNEYGGFDYSEESLIEFRLWLKKKYQSIELLNEKWNTDFWSHNYYSWDDIVFPNALSEHYGDNPNITAYQSLTLDYMRFNSDSLLNNFLMEKEIIKEITPHIPVTTNLMGMYKPLDYFKWGKEMDIVSWDNYPPNMQSQSRMALTHDLMRGINGGKQFWLMEQTPSMTACRGSNPVKPPGVMRLWSYQALAHGSNTVLFFQMRQNRNQSEKYHGAIIDHSGRNDTRTFKEVVKLGHELEKFEPTFLKSNKDSKVAIIFDWDSWWAVEMSDGPTRYLDYQQEMVKIYNQFFERNISIDVISKDDNFSKYELIIAPYLHMVPQTYQEKFEKYVESGGNLVLTCLSGIVDEYDNAYMDIKPGIFKNLAGIRIDETDSQELDIVNRIITNDNQDIGQCSMIFDIIQLDGAMPIYYYGDNFYKNTPVVTKNKYQDGFCWYVGSVLDDFTWDATMTMVLKECNISHIETPKNVEVSIRYFEENSWVFVMNHNQYETEIVSLWTGVDILSGRTFKKGDVLKIKASDLVIIKE